MKFANWMGVWFLLGAAVWAQSTCPLPPAIQPIPPGANLFSETQESDLGDVIAERLATDITVVNEESLNAHLREIGQRIVHYLPPTQFRYQFVLIELPGVNAFSLPGGRVYVARKLVVLAQNDDELAGILAHELGHIVTRQAAVEVTRDLRAVLGTTQVGDIHDIRDKYLRYLEAYRRKSVKHDSEESHQYSADQVALFAMARAGYAPHAYVDIWDRFQETHGHTGNWVSDLFGTTKPSERRLREMLKNFAALPAGCAEIHPASDVPVFQKWQAAVVSYRATKLAESLPGLVFRKELADPLRPDITSLKFSPDGKYLLAQDDGGIHVLTRDPLALVFFIDAPEANRAFFSADSRSVIFYTSALRIEIWDIATQKRTSVSEMVLRDPCIQSTLSPDGKFLGCLHEDFSLALIDVATSVPLATKDHFYEFRSYLSWLLYVISDRKSDLVSMGFSPDSHYFLAGTQSNSFAFDVVQRREASLPGSIKKLLHFSFAFLGNDRFVGIDYYSANKSPVLRFPSGEKITELPLSSATHVLAPAHGDSVLLWPLKENPLGIMDINKAQLYAIFKRNAGDVYDNFMVSERLDGEILVFDVVAKKSVASVHLVQSRLGGTRVISVSPSFNLLAVSMPNRGAVWDLSRNARLTLTRTFMGAWLADDHTSYFDFPKFEETERSLVRYDGAGNMVPIHSLEKEWAHMSGPFLIINRPAHENRLERKDWTIEIQDYRSNSPVWSRRFPKEIPELTLQSAGLLLQWPASTDAARDELQQFPELKGQAEKDDVLIELVNVQKNVLAGKVLVHTNKNSFRVYRAVADGDWLALAISGDRVLVYSLATGEQTMHLFGLSPALHAGTRQLAISTATGELNLYELGSPQVKREYQFPTSVAYKTFSSDGKRLFVLTRDQTAYILDLTALH